MASVQSGSSVPSLMDRNETTIAEDSATLLRCHLIQQFQFQFLQSLERFVDSRGANARLRDDVPGRRYSSLAVSGLPMMKIELTTGPLPLQYIDTGFRTMKKPG